MAVLSELQEYLDAEEDGRLEVARVRRVVVVCANDGYVMQAWKAEHVGGDLGLGGCTGGGAPRKFRGKPGVFFLFFLFFSKFFLFCFVFFSFLGVS